MKAIVLALLVVVVFSGLNNVGNNPLQKIVRGTNSKIYLDGKATTDYIWKAVTTPDWAQISTDGLLTLEAKNAGSWPVDVKVYDKKSG